MKIVINKNGYNMFSLQINCMKPFKYINTYNEIYIKENML